MKKTLLIFGAGGNLGSGATDELIKRDYDEIFLFNKSELKNKNFEDRVKFIRTNDLSKEENVKEAFASLEPAKKNLYFLFSTIGGFYGGKTVAETGYSDWLSMMNINLNVSFLLSKYFSRLAKEGSGGSICFTSAFTGAHAESNKSAYGVSKAGLIHLVKTLAKEGRHNAFTANAIAPDILDTEENRSWIDKPERLIKPAEIGKFVGDIFSNFKQISGNVFELSNRVEP